jgi:hypothetical protein
MWICPKCGHGFVSKNLWHSCVTVPLSAHFEGKDPTVRRTFDSWLRLARSFGPVTAYAQKSRITMMQRVRFSGVVTRKTGIDAHLWLKRKVEHPRLRKSELLPPGNWIHTFRLSSPDDLDDGLRALMGEAYAIGCQQHLT